MQIRSYLVLVFMLAFSVFHAQQKITVADEYSQLPVSGASVLCQGKLLGKTNTLGVLEFEGTCREIIVRHEDYQEERTTITEEPAEVFLMKKNRMASEIEEVVINDKSDPNALSILKKVNQRFQENSPLSLPSYRFSSFQKLAVDLDKDSLDIYNKFITAYQDSLKMKEIPVQTEKQKKDSLMEVQFQNMLKESQMFMWERAMQHLYSKKYGEKVNLLDNRISGLQQPIYELITLRSHLNKIPKEVNTDNEGLYRYYLTDSIEIDGRENYVILFREKSNKSLQNRRRFNGYIYIDRDSYAIKKIERNATKATEGSINSTWIPMYGKWFLKEEKMKINLGYQRYDIAKVQDENGKEKTLRKRFGNYAYLHNEYFDFESPVEFRSGDFAGYTYSVQNSDGTSLDEFRRDPLSEREMNTYVKIDSIGQEFKIDRRVAIVTNLLRGYLRLGKVDLDIIRLFSFNNYEGVRLGAGAKLNEHFHKYISPEGYFAYGFKDRKWKFGIATDIRTTLKKNSLFRIEYMDDVISTGKFNQFLWTTNMRIQNAGVDVNNGRYFSSKQFRLSYENDLTNALTMRITARKQELESKFEYQYLNYPNHFQDFGSILTLKYSPFSKNIMTPAGKYTYEQGYPEVYFNYEKGMKLLGGEFDYHRLDLLYLQIIKTTLGTTGTRIYAGLQEGKVPIYNTFEMGGLDHFEHQKLINRVNFTTYLGFATMPSAKYFNDRFVGYYLTHRLPWNFRFLGKKSSSIDILYKGIIGDFKNMNDHQFEFEKLDRLYQEIGFEYNNIFNTGFNLGFFYRIGHYAHPKFIDNIGFQIKLQMLGF